MQVSSDDGGLPHPHLFLTSETPDSWAVVRLLPAPCMMLLLLLVLLPPITSSRAAGCYHTTSIHTRCCRQ